MKKLILFLPISLFCVLAVWSECLEGMKPIAGGEFKMGFRDEVAKTGDFCMDIYEVTVAEYKAFKPDFVPHKLSEGDRQPVTFITQQEAEAYCRSIGKRLPTQEEWEKACRGPKNWKYPYGDKFEATNCRTNREATAGTVTVGSLTECVSAYGIFDMAGNAMEWTSSSYDQEKNIAVIKSTAWTHSMTTSRCSTRFNGPKSEKFSNTGFRCVK